MSALVHVIASWELSVLSSRREMVARRNIEESDEVFVFENLPGERRKGELRERKRLEVNL